MSTDTVERTTSRVPPHDLDAERSLLGAMLINRDAIAAAVDVLGNSNGAFYAPAHAHIYEAAIELWSRNQPADPVTVADKLHRHKLIDAIGGPATLTDLVVATPSTSNAGRYAEIISDLSQLRRLVGVGAEISEIGYTTTGDVATAVDQAEQMLFSVGDSNRRRAARAISSTIDSWLDRLIEEKQSGRPRGVRTGLVDLDALLLGLQPGQLVVAAGRPGMGKTVVGTTIARAAAAAGYPTLLVTLEMFEDEMTNRLCAADAHVPLEKLRDPRRLAPNDLLRIADGLDHLKAMPLVLDDDPTSNVMTIRASARRTASMFGGVGLVVVDYVQLVQPLKDHRGRREGEVAEVARGLKRLAGELECPVLALAQLNRDVEGRADKRPSLGDLRESGEIENASDVVVLLYRDEYYKPDSKEKGIIELHVAKQRNGPTGKVKCAWLSAYGDITNMRGAGYWPDVPLGEPPPDDDIDPALRGL